MATRMRTSRRGAPGGSITRFLLVALAGALLAWAIVPSGAGGQQYPLPTVTTAPPTPTATTPPPAVHGLSSLPLLAPFPIVRIVSGTTPRGAKVTLLTVRGGAGAYVVSRCVGAPSRCPYKQRVSRIPGRRGQIRTIHVRASNARSAQAWSCASTSWTPGAPARSRASGSAAENPPGATTAAWPTSCCARSAVPERASVRRWSTMPPAERR